MPQSVPRITADKAIKAFCKAGFEEKRVKGSHHILKKEGHRLLLTIPNHQGKTLGIGLLKAQIANAGLTVDEFCELL